MHTSVNNILTCQFIVLSREGSEKFLIGYKCSLYKAGKETQWARGLQPPNGILCAIINNILISIIILILFSYIILFL